MKRKIISTEEITTHRVVIECDMFRADGTFTHRTHRIYTRRSADDWEYEEIYPVEAGSETDKLEKEFQKYEKLN